LFMVVTSSRPAVVQACYWFDQPGRPSFCYWTAPAKMNTGIPSRLREAGSSQAAHAIHTGEQKFLWRCLRMPEGRKVCAL
jgi:hypothetical protein